MKLEIINKSKNPLPTYSTDLSAGMDVRANLDDTLNILPSKHVLVPTGLYVAIPEGYEIQVRPRSGLALKSGITVLNTPGTIDADYRGEIGIILFNTSNSIFSVNNGDRIAQIVLNKCEKIEWEQTDVLPDSTRSTGGFGSTGV